MNLIYWITNLHLLFYQMTGEKGFVYYVVMSYILVLVVCLFGISRKQVLCPICVAMHFIFKIGHVLGKQDYTHYECQNYLMYLTKLLLFALNSKNI